MSSRMLFIIGVVAAGILCASLVHACTDNTVVYALTNECSVFNGVDGGSDGVDDDSLISITGPATITVTVTGIQNGNDYWCNSGGSGGTGPTPGNGATSCSYANGEGSSLSGFTAGTSSSTGLGTLSGYTGSVPNYPVGAIVGRIGSSNTDSTATDYFQIFCPPSSFTSTSGYKPSYVTYGAGDTAQGSGTCASTTAQGGRNIFTTSGNLVSPSFSQTISVSGTTTGDLYLCYWDYQNSNDYGSISVSVTVTTTGAVCGDPQFTGLRGQSYQIHGIDGAIYNIISDRTAQVNARFSFLDGPRKCPIIPSTNKTSGACWSHPGSYLSEVAVHLIDGTKIHIQSGPAATGFDFVTVDNSTVSVGSTKKLIYISTHELRFIAGPFVIELENVDGFVNLRSVTLTRGVTLDSLKSHGLLGQTWNKKKYEGVVKEIEGDADEYVVNSLFDNDFIFNQFF